MKAHKLAPLKSLLPLSLLFLTCASLPMPGLSQKHSRPADSNLLETGHAANLSHTPKTPAEIKIVSYNIRWRGGNELRQLIKLFKDDPEIGGAAIIGLQEVDRNKARTGSENTVRLIAEELGKHYAWTAPPSTEPDKEEETGVAIVSTYPLADVHRILLPHEGPGRRRRVALGATVTIAGSSLRVYSVHSENRIPVAKKIGQMNAVLHDLARYPKDMPAVILGDLNTWEPDAVKRTSRLFVGENFTTPFPNGNSTFQRTILSIPFRLKLDWIWVRGLEPTGYGIDRKIGLSDHWPLWTVVRMRPGT